MKKKVLFLVLLACISAPARGADEAGERVEFSAGDGVVLVGHIVGTGPVGVVLGHMFPSDQKSWFGFARRLGQEGFTAMTFDFRGYGESKGEREINKIDLDMEAAGRFLAARVQKVFFIGASMGGTAALKAAVRVPVAGVVTISSPLVFKGLDATADIPQINAAKLFIATADDGNAAHQAEKMLELAKEPKGKLIFPDGGHGTFILATPRGTELTTALLEFVKTPPPPPAATD